MNKSRLIVSGIILCFLTITAFPQEKVNLKVGASYPEILHIGARYQLKQFQFGGYVGTGVPLYEDVYTLSGDVSYHFG